MALKVSYTDIAGVTHANSYWVISDIKMLTKLILQKKFIKFTYLTQFPNLFLKLLKLI